MKNFLVHIGMLKTPVNTVSLQEKSKTLKSIDSSYNQNLTKSLKDEHIRIVRQFDKILRLFRSDKFEGAREEIRLIVDSYFTHATRKQSRVYTFLEACFSGNRTFIDHMKQCRKELGQCNNDLLSFFNNWTVKDLSAGGIIFENDLIKAKESFINRHSVELDVIYRFYDAHERMLSNPTSWKMNSVLPSSLDEDVTEIDLYSQDSVEAEDALHL